MTMTISILVVAWLAAIGLLVFAPMAEFRRRGLKAVLVSAALVTALGMGTCFATFAGLMLSSNPVLARFSTHALMAAIAMPLVLGLAALAFGAMAATWPNVFARPNDRFATNIYVLIGVAIVVACASSSLHTDWPGYLIAAIAVPLLPAIANRRLRRSRPAGFGADTAVAYLPNRPELAGPRFAAPIIAPRAAPKPKRLVSRATKPGPRPVQQTASTKKAPPRTNSASTQAPKAIPAKAVSTKAAPAPAFPENRHQGHKTPGKSPTTALIKLSIANASRLIGAFRRRIAIKAASGQVPAGRSKPATTQRALPKASVTKTPARASAVSRPAAATQSSQRRAAPATTPAPAPAPTRQESKPLPKPALLPDRVLARTTPAPAKTAPDRKLPAEYPLTAPFEPGSDRWATFIDGVLTTETGIQRKIAARSTQALEDLSGAA